METFDGIKVGTKKKQVLFVIAGVHYTIDPKRAREFAELLLTHAQTLDYRHPCNLCGG